MSATKSVPPTDAPPGYEPPPLPPETVQALRVFKANLPGLLEKHYGQVAACDSGRVLYVGDDQQALYKRCLKRGYKDAEIVVLWIVPDAADFID